MTMHPPDGSRQVVELSVTSAARASEVWRALVDPTLGPQWMGMRIVSSWKVGSEVAFTETSLGPGYRESGKLLDFEPGHLIQYDHWSTLWRVPNLPENRAVMTFRVESLGSSTRVTLRHDLPKAVEAIAEHSAFFWRTGLSALRRLMES